MTSFSERLREERGRLGLNQTDFAAAGGKQRDAQQNYENGSRRPDSSYLEAIASLGVDVLYLLTGDRSVAALTPLETELITRFRAAPDAVKGAVIGALMVGSAPEAYRQNFDGATIGQQVSGDVTGPFSINVGATKKPRSTPE